VTLIEVPGRHIHAGGLPDSAGYDINEYLKIERLGDNARERGSSTTRALTELGLSQVLGQGCVDRAHSARLPYTRTGRTLLDLLRLGDTAAARRD
jgi:hypothetical protein